MTDPEALSRSDVLSQARLLLDVVKGRPPSTLTADEQRAVADALAVLGEGQAPPRWADEPVGLVPVKPG
jgi:hypothetical protein